MWDALINISDVLWRSIIHLNKKNYNSAYLMRIRNEGFNFFEEFVPKVQK